MTIATVRAQSEAALAALVPFIRQMEPAMPVDEAKRLANGLLGLVTAWSVEREPLPEVLRRQLTLSPWNDQSVKPPLDVSRGLSRLLKACPKCKGHGQRPVIAVGWKDNEQGECPVCGPVREFIFKTYGVDFERLT